MGITDTSSRVTHSGDGSTVDFAFNFRVFSDDDIKVILRTDSDGTEAVQTLTTDYTVALNDGEGGTVTMGTPPASGETLYIGKDVDETQPDDITVGTLRSATIEQMVDRVTMLVHQIKDLARRAPKFRETTDSLDKTIAEPSDGKLLGWNASGNLVNYDTSTLSTGTLVLDEDDMSSDSATAVPTQQSTKAYVDTLKNRSVTKVLGTDYSGPDTTLLTFTGLKANTNYLVVGQFYFDIDSGGLAVDFEYNSTRVGWLQTLTTESLDGIDEQSTKQVSFLFNTGPAATDFLVKSSGLSGTKIIRGDGTKAESFLTVIELNNTEAVLDF